MSTSDVTRYTPGFYAESHAGTASSAATCVALLDDLVAPRSVLDVGCGTATWLAAWRAAGVADVQGFDGAYVERAALEIPTELFSSVDLETPIPVRRRFDLAMSLEVAEHLSPSAGDALVTLLAASADAVAFSAAVPGQGGNGHVHERWPDWWAERFAAHGMEAFDVLRPQIWERPDVLPWYRQNLLLLARGDAARRVRERSATDPGRPRRLVDPEIFAHALAARGGGSAALGNLWRAVGRRVRAS